MDTHIYRATFRILNRFFMVPAFRFGLGQFVGTPFGGYILVLKTKGWKSGKERFAPVNYAIQNGNVYCLSGFGKESHWYLNLVAQPNIEVLLPGRTIIGLAEDITGDSQRLAILRQILKNSGFAAFLAGINPFRIADDELSKETRTYRLIRITPTGVVNGAADPGGYLWMLLLGLSIGLLLLLLL